MEQATKDKIAASLRGREVTQEFRAKMSAVRKAAAPARVCECGSPATRETPAGWVCIAHFSRWRRTGRFDWDRPIKPYRPHGNAKTAVDFHLQRRNVTAERYAEVLQAQGGVCAICKTSSPGRSSARFCLDHDHHEVCGCKLGGGCPECIRGLLCHECNLVLLPQIEAAIRSGLVVATGLDGYLRSRPFKP